MSQRYVSEISQEILHCHQICSVELDLEKRQLEVWLTGVLNTKVLMKTPLKRGDVHNLATSQCRCDEYCVTQ